MAVGEGGPADVLTAQANVVALVQEGAHGEGLRQAPVDLGKKIKTNRQIYAKSPKLRQITKYDKLLNCDKLPNLRQSAKFTTKRQIYDKAPILRKSPVYLGRFRQLLEAALHVVLGKVRMEALERQEKNKNKREEMRNEHISGGDKVRKMLFP